MTCLLPSLSVLKFYPHVFYTSHHWNLVPYRHRLRWNEGQKTWNIPAVPWNEANQESNKKKHLSSLFHSDLNPVLDFKVQSRVPFYVGGIRRKTISPKPRGFCVAHPASRCGCDSCEALRGPVQAGGRSARSRFGCRPLPPPPVEVETRPVPLRGSRVSGCFWNLRLWHVVTGLNQMTV